jgi:predicted Zn-dependent peptidase
MKIRVISEFYDKFHTSTLFKVGTVLDFDDVRAMDVISKKLAEPYSEPEKKPEPKPEPKAEAKAEQPEPKKPGRPAKVKEDSKTDEKEKAEV